MSDPVGKAYEFKVHVQKTHGGLRPAEWSASISDGDDMTSATGEGGTAAAAVARAVEAYLLRPILRSAQESEK